MDGPRLWIEPIKKFSGYSPTGSYVEWFWLPVVGPSVTWLYRRLVQELEIRPDGFWRNIPELATELGLSTGVAKNSPIMKSIERMVAFHLADSATVTKIGDQLVERPTLRVKTMAGRLSEGMHSRLSTKLQAMHDQVADRLLEYISA